MKALESFVALGKLLHQLSKWTGNPWLDSLALSIGAIAFICFLAAGGLMIALSALSLAGPARRNRRLNLRAVLVGTLVSYALWIVSCWCTLAVLAIMFLTLDLDLSHRFNWVVLICSWSLSLCFLYLNISWLNDTSKFPMAHACLVASLFIIIDYGVSDYVAFPISFGRPLAVNICTLIVALIAGRSVWANRPNPMPNPLNHFVSDVPSGPMRSFSREPDRIFVASPDGNVVVRRTRQR